MISPKVKATIKSLTASVFLSILAGASCTPAGTVTTTPTNFNTDFRLVIPQTSEPYVAVNGDNNEVRWTNDAFDLGFIDGTDQDDAFMMGVADANNLYLYFELEEIDYTTSDTVVVLIAPDPSNAADNRLLLIHPCRDVLAQTGVCDAGLGNNKLGTVAYHVIDPMTTTWDAGTQNPALLNNKVKIETITASPGYVRYGVEIEISRADFNLPATGYFGLYTNIMQSSITSIDVLQYTWPFSNMSGNAGDLLIYDNLTELPADTVWGNATLDDSNGPGVFIVGSDIFTNHGGGSTISTNEQNTFTAIARNADNSATDLAEDVVATFRWANFGLPSRSSFHKIPTDAVAAARGNPPPSQDVQPTTSATYSFDWSVSDEAPADQVDYTAGSHWCLQVELTSTAPVTFYDSMAQRNMNFAETASPFLRTATISAEGIKAPANSRVHEYILEERFYNFDPRLKWESELQGAEKLGNGFYRLKVPMENPLKIDLSVLPPQEALVPFETITVGKEATRIELKPGYIVTLLTEDVKRDAKPLVRALESGAVETRAVEGQASSISSRESGVIGAELEPKTNDDKRQVTRISAAWGTENGPNKEAAFMLSPASTVKVPKDTPTLFLSLAGDETKEKTLRVYATKIQDYHLFANPSLLQEGKNIHVGLAANLPTVVYRGKRNIGRTITIQDKRFNVYAPVGSFSYIVKGKKENR